MRYEVPQFIEFESKIVGPLTFRQFAYLIGAGGGTYILYRILGIFPGIIIMIPLWAISLSLAFVRINNRPFVDTMAAAFSFFLGSKLYVWKKVDKPIEASVMDEKQPSTADEFVAPTLSQSKLKELAWGLDIKQNVFSGNQLLDKSEKH